MSDFDVIVVGAGPAGSTLASFLGAAGTRVLLLDKEIFPREKVCGEYMSPQTLATLHRSGVLDRVEALPHRKLRGILVHSYDGTCSRGTYGPVGPHAPFRPYGIAVRRFLLDHVLLRHAASRSSVLAIEGFKVDGLVREGDRVVGVRGSGSAGPAEYRARLVVGADGVRSVVGRLLGLSEFAPEHTRFALAAYYRGMRHEDYGELHMGRPGYVALAPVDKDTVHLNFVVDKGSIEEARGDLEGYLARHLAANPRLADRMRQAERVGPVRATGPMAKRCRGAVAPGALLVGDAAEFVDPFTGEGLYIAMRSAELAAPVVLDALARGRFDAEDLAAYERARDAEFAQKIRMCWLIQKHLSRTKLADYIVHRLAGDPSLADRLTAVTGDYCPPEAVMTLGFYLNLLNPFAARPAAAVAG